MRNYKLYLGDTLEVLKTLPDNSAHVCVTSPPYWFLREYDTTEWEGGDDNCKHSIAGNPDSRHTEVDVPLSVNSVGNCTKCGAIRIDKQLGLETTYEEYVDKMSKVFLELRRVLRADGTLWLNLGDTYINQSKGGGGNKSKIQNTNKGSRFNERKITSTLPLKNMVGIPWRVAFALQNDGWILRNDIIFAKQMMIPESVKDRLTKSHEHIFLMSNDDQYYYDRWNIMEKSVGSDKEYGIRNKRDVWFINTSNNTDEHYATFSDDLVKPCILAGTSEYGVCSSCGAQYIREVESTKHSFRTTGWKKPCKCKTNEVEPATVIDIFSGTGTTGDCSLRYGRSYIGIDLSKKYNSIAEKRLQKIIDQIVMHLGV